MSSTSEFPPELLELLHHWILREFVLVAKLAPDMVVTQSPDKLQADANEALHEHLKLFEFLAVGFIDQEAAQRYPYAQLLVRHTTGPADSEGAFTAPKRIDHRIVNSEDATSTALMIAFLTSPAARQLLRVYGYQYRLVQAAQVHKKVSPIILSN